MAKQVEGTMEKVLQSAKSEFLQFGSEKASMRRGNHWRALYTVSR